MNRLWVRLSLMISGVLFFVFFMQFMAITLDEANRGQDDMDGISAPPAEIQSRLLGFMGFSIVVGAGSGFVIGKVVSNPISRLSKATRKIGQGDLGARVPVRGSQEMVELAETFNKMATDLQHAENQRNNLMADVSHELRTPLTVLEGNLRAAIDRVYLLDEAEIANLYEQTRHLIRLVNDLREISLAEAGQLPLEKIPTDLKRLTDETLLALESLGVEKNISLVNMVPEVLEVNVDPFRIRQVLFNLLTNALRHTPAGGEITISGESRPSEVEISIQDNGEGLTDEQLQVVFDRFYRGEKSRSRESGGTGLGLAIVKAIVEAHAGRVEAYSSGKGQGSQFRVILPLL